MQRDYWNDVAGPKWAAGQAQMDEVLEPYAEALREAATVADGATLVDVGCGCGATTLMARECSPSAEILGLDVSEPMLEVARRRAQAQSGKAIRFVLGDAASHGLPDGSVDRVLSRFGVMFFADPGAAFAHMGLWLKPEGRLVATVWAPPEDNPWMAEVIEVVQRHVELPAPDPEAPGPFSLGSPSRRRRIFEQAQLQLVEEQVLDQPLRIRGDVPMLVRFLCQRGPVQTALASASAAQRAAILADVEAYAKEHHDGDGMARPAKALRFTLAPDARREGEFYTDLDKGLGSKRAKPGVFARVRSRHGART